MSMWGNQSGVCASSKIARRLKTAVQEAWICDAALIVAKRKGQDGDQDAVTFCRCVLYCLEQQQRLSVLMRFKKGLYIAFHIGVCLIPN